MSSELARKLKDLRLQKGMTLEQVGDIVGVGKSTVRKWETGMIANMKRDKIALLAQALGTTPAYLMGWDDDKKANSPEYANLSEGEKMWLELYHRLSSDTRELIIKSFDKLDKMPEDRQKFVRDVILVAFQDKK